MFGKMKVAMLAAVFVALVHPAAGQQESAAQAPARCTADDGTLEERLDRGTIFGGGCFELWTGCGNIATIGGSIVLFLDGERVEEYIGLRTSTIANAVQSRLRAAGVYSAETRGNDNFLSLVVRFYGRGDYTMSLQFSKGFLRDKYGFSGNISTWETSSHGRHAGSASFLMESVRQKLDRFMNQYLLVNEPACSRR